MSYSYHPVAMFGIKFQKEKPARDFLESHTQLKNITIHLLAELVILNIKIYKIRIISAWQKGSARIDMFDQDLQTAYNILTSQGWVVNNLLILLCGKLPKPNLI